MVRWLKMAKKYYAVQSGRKTGVFTSWNDVRQLVDGVPGAVHKSFPTESEARAFSEAKSGYAPVRKSSLPAGGSSTVSKPRLSGEPHVKSRVSRAEASQQARSRQRSRRDSSGSEKDGSDGRLVVYTDGSSRGNGQAGARAGWGVWYGNGDPRNSYGSLDGDVQTNQRAELAAINRALDDALDSGSRDLEIRTDSIYSEKALTVWSAKWQRNGFVSSTGRPVANQDLVREGISKIAQLKTKGINVRFRHVAGHSGEHGNEEADKLANLGAASG